MIPGLRVDGPEGAIVLIVIFALLVVAAIFITPVALVGIPSYFAYRLYRDSPSRHERLAREQTETLLAAIRDANVTLSEHEIERALLADVPGKTPKVVKDQLVEVGKDLFAVEGISPVIPPPPPLHNTVEGARQSRVRVTAT